MSKIIQTDVLVIGGGPGGAATALFLAKKGIRSVVVDKSVFPRDKICGDALSGKVVEMLSKLDPKLTTQFGHQSSQVGSWGVKFVAPNGKTLRVPFKSDSRQHSHPPGFISKRLDFDQFLIDQVKKEEKIRLIQGETLRRFEFDKDQAVAHSANLNLTIQSKMIIAADGAKSVFARKVADLNVANKHNAFGLRAYYKGVEGMDPQNFIELHFLKEMVPGYFWIFPLPDGMANIGLGLRSDMLSRRHVNLKKKLNEIINDNPSINLRFKNAELIGGVKLHELPLGSVKRKISGERYLLVGDAAALIDPFTGEGIGNAMVSGMLAAQQAEQAILRNDFSASTLSGYDEQVYQRLWSELSLSARLQQLANVPWLFNFVVNKAVKSKTLSETISCMFEDMDLRARLKKPSFYLNLLFTNS